MPVTAAMVAAQGGDATALRATLKEGGCELEAREDEHGGTAFLCDAGFTGPHDSVIGRDWEPVVTRFLTSQPQRFPVSKGRILLQGVMIEVYGATGKATSIERVSEAL